MAKTGRTRQQRAARAKNRARRKRAELEIELNRPNRPKITFSDKHDPDTPLFIMAESGGGVLRECPNCGQRFRSPDTSFGVLGDGLSDIQHILQCPRCGEEFPVKMQVAGEPETGAVYSESQQGAEMIRALITQAIASNTPAAEVADAIEQHHPRFKPLADWLRANPWFMTLSAAIVAPILTVLLTHWLNSPQQPTVTEINQIIIEQVPGR